MRISILLIILAVGYWLSAQKMDTIPFIFEEGKIIIVAEINKKPSKFMIDTGAPTILSKAFVKKNRLKDQAIPHLIINNSDFYDITFESHGFNTSKGIKHHFSQIAGILGSDFLSMNNWLIDFKNRILVVNPDTSEHRVAYSIEFVGDKKNRPIVTFSDDQNRYQFIALFDTGSPDGFNLNASFLNFMDIKTTLVGKRKFYDLDGKHNCLTYKSEPINVTLGNLLVNDTTILFSCRHSVIGNSFMENYKVSIDWKNHKIWLIP